MKWLQELPTSQGTYEGRQIRVDWSILWHRKDRVSYRSRHCFSILILFIVKVTLFPLINGSSISSQNHALLQVLILPYKTQICKEHKKNPVLIATDHENQTSQKSHIRALLICSVSGGTIISFASFKNVPALLCFSHLCLVTSQIHFIEHPIPQLTHSPP